MHPFDKDKYDQLLVARERYRQATAHYDTQVDLFRHGGGSELELQRAFQQRQAIYQEETRLLHEVFPITEQ